MNFFFLCLCVCVFGSDDIPFSTYWYMIALEHFLCFLSFSQCLSVPAARFTFERHISIHAVRIPKINPNHFINRKMFRMGVFFCSIVRFPYIFNFQYRLAIIDFIGNDSKSHRLYSILPGTQNSLTEIYWSIYLFPRLSLSRSLSPSSPHILYTPYNTQLAMLLNFYR